MSKVIDELKLHYSVKFYIWINVSRDEDIAIKQNRWVKYCTHNQQTKGKKNSTF